MGRILRRKDNVAVLTSSRGYESMGSILRLELRLDISVDFKIGRSNALLKEMGKLDLFFTNYHQ